MVPRNTVPYRVALLKCALYFLQTTAQGLHMEYSTVAQHQRCILHEYMQLLCLAVGDSGIPGIVA